MVKCNESDNASVLGIAYEIEKDKVDETFKYLDFREKCGYSKHEVDFYPINLKENKTINNKSFKCFCYYADETNPYYSIKTDNNYIAEHIIKSKGPSGSNIEYFINLCNRLKELIKISEGDDEINTTKLYIQNEQNLFDLEVIIKQKLIEKQLEDGLVYH